MPLYRVCGHDDLVRRAVRERWVVGGIEPQTVVDRVEPVRVSDGTASPHWLPECEVQTQNSLRLQLPDVVVHGGNLSLIVDDCIYPGGLAHSMAPSPRWKAVGPGLVRYEPVVGRALGDAELLGLVCHFGHFFVDALDRLLEMAARGAVPEQLLVSDPDLFQLHPSIDECGAVPQVSELIRLSGLEWTPRSALAVPRAQDLAVERLTVQTLRSTKPSISAASFVELRQRVGVPNKPHDPGAGNLVFVGRSAVRKRFVRNQEQLSAYLLQAHAGQTVFPEFMSIREAVDAFSAADRVLLPVGSAKFNLAFCRPGTRVVCVNPKGYTQQPGGVTLMVRHLCHALGLRLAFYEVDIEPQKMLLHSNLLFTERDGHAMMDLFAAMESP